MPCASSRGTISPHPCAFTRVVLHCSEYGTAGLRLVTSTGTSSGSRVLRRMACWVFSEGPIGLAGKRFFGLKASIFKIGAVDSGNNYPRTMLDHRQVSGTQFRRPCLQLDTSIPSGEWDPDGS